MTIEKEKASTAQPPSSVSGSGSGRIRLGLIGPLLPYRGGVARHTTLLRRELAGRADLTMISYARQYPARLFPGRTLREPGFEAHREPDSLYLLKPFSPPTWNRACRILRERDVAAAVIPWWTVYWAACDRHMTSRLRRAGIPVIFFCHNILDHEERKWKWSVARRVLGQGDAFLTHAWAAADRLRTFLPQARVAVHTHPIPHDLPPPAGRRPRRAALELLFFGIVRPYKGLDLLAAALERLPGADIALTVAGEWWVRDRNLRRRLAGLPIAGGVEILDRYLPAAAAAELFDRADAVVLPYLAASGSGVIPQAYCYEKPVIATAVGGMPEAVEDGVTGRLVPPGDPEALAAVIREFPSLDTAGLRAGVRDLARKLTWESLAGDLLALAETVRRTGPARPV